MLNVLQQKSNLLSFPFIKELYDANKINIYLWWFDLKLADLYQYNEKVKRFVIIDNVESNNESNNEIHSEQHRVRI